MITNDPRDITYAKTCKIILDESERLIPEEIENRFQRAASTCYGAGAQPKNIMLQIVHTGVIWDELDPCINIPGSDPGENLERFRKIINDYLSGNFYESFYALSGTYRKHDQGCSWNIKIVDGTLAIECGNIDLWQELNRVAGSLILTNNTEADLKQLIELLPERIGNFALKSSKLGEYLL